MLFCSYLGLMALVLMLCALPFLTGKGYYIFQTFDDWSGSLPLVVIALFQCIAVAWVYGNDKYVLIDSSLSFLSNIISYFRCSILKLLVTFRNFWPYVPCLVLTLRVWPALHVIFVQLAT